MSSGDSAIASRGAGHGSTLHARATAAVLGFDELRIDDVDVAGGKGANVGELAAAGLPVPDGFVVSAPAYLSAMDEGGVRGRLQEAVAGFDLDDPSTLARLSAELQALVRQAGVPDHLRDAPSSRATAQWGTRSRSLCARPRRARTPPGRPSPA